MKVGVAGTATTLAAPGKAVGASSINVASTTNHPTDTAYVIAIRQVDSSGRLVAGTYCEFIGLVASSGVITINPTPVFGTDQIYPAGSTTQVYIPVSSAAHAKLIDGILVAHNQDGTHKSGVVLLAPTIADFTSAQHDHGDADDGGNIPQSSITNPYKFRASRNAAANTGNGAFGVIAFDTEQCDTGSNLASGVFTAPADGFYRFSWNITATLSTGADEAFVAALFVNGTETSRGNYVTARNTQGSSGSDTVQLTAGQTVDIRVYAPVARPLSVGNIFSNYFSGHLVSKS